MALTTLVPLTQVPIDIGRDEAQELARRELSEQVYRDAEPSVWERASTWMWERLNELFAKAGDALGGAGWVFVLAVVAVAVVVLIAWRAGTVERRHRAASTVVFDDERLSARQHRERAELAAARSDWGAAVIESFRAIVRDVEERGWLDERPGRTADEAAREVGRHFHSDAADLMLAARTFDEVAYGERAGTPEGYALVGSVEQRIRTRSPAPTR